MERSLGAPVMEPPGKADLIACTIDASCSQQAHLIRKTRQRLKGRGGFNILAS